MSIKPTMLDGLKILFVDDDADVLLLVKTLLVNAHAEVITAASGREALALLDTAKPNVIISDISMPGFDGYQFITALRDRKILTPAIALTAQSRTKDQQKALDAGFNMHLRKPMRALTLIAAISELVAP
jgi:CheY-like chemotaxis protein